MSLMGQATLLRVFVGETDRLDGKPLYERILLLARERGLAGATVLRGVASYGASSRLHTAKVLRLSEDLQMVIEIVDSAAAVTAFVPELDALLERAGQGGLVTLEKVDVIRFKPHSG